MQISDTELKKVIAMGGIALIPNEEGFVPSPREGDEELIKQVVSDVMNMPDRSDRIEELKAKIEAGEYNVTGDEIANAMIRRNMADKIR
jgi:hypothetical protein